MVHRIYATGTPVWYDDKDLGWVQGEVVEAIVSGTDVHLTLSNERHGKPVVIRTSTGEITSNDARLPPLRNSGDFDCAPDLVSLPHLNEPSILQVIGARYAQKKIYTYSGIVLIAVNPFCDVPLYDSDMIRAYAGRARESLEPHLFTIAEETFTALRHTRRPQTVIISGESGAGKTESAKYIMRYLASVNSASKGIDSPVDGSTSVEHQILATNPILEAFGNAKTTRNDNSSRFGKYIQILFDRSYNIIGARIRTYLLERARISFQQRGERNYHIFYQLCTGASPEERAALFLDRPANEFAYLASSPGADEASSFRATKRALSVVGIDSEKQMQIFALLSGLLHLGNIDIRQHRDNPDAIVDESDSSLVTAMHLLGINLKEFRKWTATKHFAARGEDIKSARTAAQARGVRDGVAKYIYSCLFDWLVGQVNASLGTDDVVRKEQLFIAVLDIYGFEHFEMNSFEQFCINYANEKLQQQFTSHVFKIQQAEYSAEDIDWKTIDFQDNQPTIDLIEARLGILAILDEESRLAAGTDNSFIEKLNWQLLGQGQTPKTTQSCLFRSTPDAFIVTHYAHSVEYSIDGFLERNRGTVPDEHMALILDSSNAFLREVVEAGTVRKTHPANKSSSSYPSRPTSPSDRPSSHRATASVDVREHVRKLTNTAPTAVAPKTVNTSRKPTQCSIFKASLNKLMDTLAQTDVHYIRCIKPNEEKRPWDFDRPLVLDQLRACGVLETVRISCSGYPSRWTYEDFVKRYAVLLPTRNSPIDIVPDEAKAMSLLILKRFVEDETRYRPGRTKIFFRLRVLAILEGLRFEHENRAAVTLQCAWRSALARAHLMWLRERKAEEQRLAREREEQKRLERERAEYELLNQGETDQPTTSRPLSIVVTGQSSPLDSSLPSSLPTTPRTPGSPKSSRRTLASPSPRLHHSRSFVRSPQPGLASVPEFSYQQDTLSSARRKIDILEHEVTKQRGRDQSHIGGSPNEKSERMAKSVERARSRDPSRGRPPPTPEKDKGKASATTSSFGGLINRSMSLTREKTATSGKEKHHNRLHKEHREKDGMAKRMKWRFGRTHGRETSPPPPITPPPPTDPPSQPALPTPTPIYNKFMTGKRQTPWYLTAEV